MAKENKSEFRLVWKIENYSFCCQLNDYSLSSPIFSFPAAKNLSINQWCLMFYPKNLDYVSCELLRIENGDICDIVYDIVVDFKLEIIAANGKILKSIETTHDFTESYYTWDKIRKNEEIINELKNCVEDTLIISCHMKCDESRLDRAPGCRVLTKIDVNRLSFRENVDFSFDSDLIWKETCHFTHKMFFEIVLTSPHDDLLIHIRLINKPSGSEYFAVGKIAMLDNHKVEINSNNASHLFSKLINTGEDKWQFPSFVKKSQLKGLNINNFTLMFDISISDGTHTSVIEKGIFDWPVCFAANASVGEFSTFHSDLRSMFESKKHCDVELQVGRRSFPAHKALLAARSPVLSAMFEQDMKESQTGFVEILDIDENTLESFLNYLYTDSVIPENTSDYRSLVNLLMVADKYQVPSLREKCSFFLLSNMSADNVCEILGIANMMGHKVLKDYAINYIKIHSEEILSKEQ